MQLSSAMDSQVYQPDMELEDSQVYEPDMFMEEPDMELEPERKTGSQSYDEEKEQAAKSKTVQRKAGSPMPAADSQPPMPPPKKPPPVSESGTFGRHYEKQTRKAAESAWASETEGPAKRQKTE